MQHSKKIPAGTNRFTGAGMGGFTGGFGFIDGLGFMGGLGLFKFPCRFGLFKFPCRFGLFKFPWFGPLRFPYRFRFF